MRINVECRIEGLAYQTIELYDGCDLTPEQVLRGLNDCEIETRFGSDAFEVVDVTTSPPKAVGRIVRQGFDAAIDSFETC